LQRTVVQLFEPHLVYLLSIRKWCGLCMLLIFGCDPLLRRLYPPLKMPVRRCTWTTIVLTNRRLRTLQLQKLTACEHS
jgi:hypothetical protein